MDTFTSEQVEVGKNIISLFGDPILPLLEDEQEEHEMDAELIATQAFKEEDVFSPKIANEDVSLDIGLVIIGDQLNNLRKKMKRTSFYLSDLDNLL